jgi:uncharacterized membrane protein
MFDAHDRQRLEDLEQRVAQLEAALAAGRREEPPLAEAADGPAGLEDQPLPTPSPRTMPPPLPVKPVTPAALNPPTPPAPIPPAPLIEAPAAVLPYAPRADQLAPAPTPAPAHGPLEQMIGLKGAGWVGAIVLVLGAAFGIKYGYEQGYFSGIPAAARVAMMALGGLALVGAGEWVYRRINHLSAVGLYAAGVAVLFLVAYFGHAYYALYSREAAFTFMAVAMLIGSAVAMRGQMVSVAVLSLLGGNLAPLVLPTQGARVVPLLSYLLMLQIVALVLADWGASRKWWTLRTLSLVTTGLWVAGAIDGAGMRYDAAGAPLIFTLIFAGLYQLELILSAWRTSPGPGPAEPAGQAVQSPTIPGLLFSAVVTAVLTAALLWIFADATALVRGGWVLGLAAAAALDGFMVPLLFGPRTRGLAIGYRVQAAGLLVVAVPVLWEGPAVVVGWGVLALAFALMGALLDLKVARRAAAATWVLAVAWGYGWWQGGLTHAEALRTWWTIGQTALPAFVILGWLLMLAAHAIALLTLWQRRKRQAEQGAGGEDWQMFLASSGLLRTAWVVQACGGLVFVAVSVAGLPTLGATLALLAYAWLLALGDAGAPRLQLILQAGAVLALAMVKWVTVDLLADRLKPTWSASAHAVLLNPLMGVGTLIALSLLGLYALRRQRLTTWLETRADGRAVGAGVMVGGLVLLLLTIGLSFEIDRVVEAARASGGVAGSVRAGAWPALQLKQLGWTMLWMVFSGALLGLIVKLQPPGQRREEALRGVAALPLLLALKYLTLDTLTFRLAGHPAHVAVLANLQTLAALVVLGGLLEVYFLIRAAAPPHPAHPAHPAPPAQRAGPVHWLAGLTGAAAVLVLLWTGTLEIDRYFAFYSTAAHPALARTVGFSIFWSLFAIGCILLGFLARTAPLRYAGLALFAITLGKVLFLDMAEVSTGYRILSFLALGLLLLGTSVVYGRRWGGGGEKMTG